MLTVDEQSKRKIACFTSYFGIRPAIKSDGILMLLGFVFVIMGIEFYQEKKTEKALDALKDLASPRALVIRNGIEKRIPGREVVTDDIEEQTELVFQAIEKILKAADASIDDVVKAQIFLTDINDFSKVSAIRDKWFAKSKPVSTLVEVNAMTRKGAKVEIEVTAIIKK